jgi:rhamnose utilization protein RhaD (predicted bifunctional aldolase and dehydrogenase)
MGSACGRSRCEELIRLSHELGREDRGLAILGEGNASTRADGGFLVKASGASLATLTAESVVACRPEELLALMDVPDASDEQIDASLRSSRLDPTAVKPSVEAMFHAYLLSLPGVEWVGHAHPVPVNGILCSPRAAEFAGHRIFPDEVVCCGEESVFVPYVDPGLKLAVAIRQRTEAFRKGTGTVPRVILLANHGVITLGATASAVLGGMLMVRKAAEIWIAAAALGGPAFLGAGEVRRIAGRADEHYRRRALNL